MTKKMDYFSNDISNYMSDEELELLIADVEQNELVAAPPDMMDKILERIRENEADFKPVSDVGKNQNKQEAQHLLKSVAKIQEFRRYCYKVCASVAAAIILVFVLPVMTENSITNTAKQDLFIREGRYATKEEALNDKSYLYEKLGDTNIFSKEREIGIFSSKMEDK